MRSKIKSIFSRYIILKMKIKLLGALLLLVWLVNSCNMINPKEGVPTYIQIDSVQVNPTDLAKHGSVNHKIKDVWVYYQRQLLGAFELPAKIPVLATGKGQLQVVAGIWDNGLSGTRAKYPFYTVDTFTFNANPTNTIKHIPKFNYRTTEDVITYFIENFEQGNTFVRRFGDSSFARTKDPTEVFEDEWSGKIDLHDTINYVEIITSKEFFLPINREAYLELNYKSDIDFTVRTEIYHLGNYYNFDIIGLKAKQEWTKVYLNLTGFSATYQGGKSKYVIQALLPTNKSSAKVLIDNFKIIYFN